MREIYNKVAANDARCKYVGLVTASRSVDTDDVRQHDDQLPGEVLV